MSSKWAKGTAGPAGDEHHNLIPVHYAIQEGATRINPDSGPRGLGVQSDIAYTLEAQAQAIAFPARMSATQVSTDIPSDICPALTSRNPMAIANEWAVRRLTPLECERLMGFPDHYTNVPFRGKPASDSARYRALGNSWAINCARWVGERIQAVESACAAQISQGETP